MTPIATIGLVFLASVVHSAPQDYRTTPVPILKQINRHNDDGSYSYGYEGADGTYKIETKYPTGEVYGKYGYIGDDGKLREVEYGASKRGFEPSGADINVAPPTLSDRANSTDYDDYDEDFGSFTKQKSLGRVYKNKVQAAPVRNTFTNKFQSPAYQAPQYYQPQTQYYQPQPQYYQSQPQYYQSQPQYYQSQPQHYQSQAQFQYYRPHSRFAQFTFDPALFNGHPATNFDINTGSYTITYTG